MPPTPRRILFVLPPVSGGFEIFVELAAGLRARGFDAEVLTSITARAHELDAGVRFHYYDVVPHEPCSIEVNYFAFQMVWGYTVFGALRRLEPDFDLIFAHLPWGLVKLYAYRRRRPLVGFIDCCWTDMWHFFNPRAHPPTPEPPWVNWHLGRFCQDHTMRGCDRVIAPSAFFRDHHGGKGLSIDVIRHGVDPRRFRPDADRRAERARLGLPADRKMVLLVGFAFSLKGHQHFAELAIRLRDEGAFFVALGPLADEFRWCLDRDPALFDRLFVRRVPHQDVASYYAAADLFVFPTYFETFGLSPVEAMASGIPVVAHRTASLPELVDDGVEGYLVPVADVDALEARVRELLRDDARRRAMGEAGRARFLRDFTADRMRDEYAAYLGRLLA